MVDEAKRTGDAITAIMLADERMLATGFAALGVAATVAVVKGATYTLMALPFALSVLICFVEYQHSRLMSFGGYKAALEEALLARIGVPVIAWESQVAPRLHRAAAVLLVRYLVAVFFAGTVTVAIAQAWKSTKVGQYGYPNGNYILAGTIASVFLGVAASTWSVISAGRQFESTKKLTTEQLAAAWLADLPKGGG